MYQILLYSVDRSEPTILEEVRFFEILEERLGYWSCQYPDDGEVVWRKAPTLNEMLYGYRL